MIETQGFGDYRLLDSGGGRKLERFGSVVVDRPEPQALWSPSLAAARWQAAHAVFSGEGEDEAGRWRTQKPVPESWPLDVVLPGSGAAVKMLARLSAFRHLGLFPEQLPHWQWMIEALRLPRTTRPRVLNLFAYTGAATLLAAGAGAEVVHVDASKKAISWARENQAASGLEQAPVRWIVEDARSFVAREVRRKRTYDLILVDPPKFGRGPEGEVWDLFNDIRPLIRDCSALLAPGPARLVLTAYAIRASSLAIGQLLAEVLREKGGEITCGELAIREEAGARAVPTSLYARWSSVDAA